MTGGGFGGCTVNLVAEDQAAAFCTSLRELYQRATGIEPVIFVTKPSDGVQAVPLT
jgi:galactokinase